MAMAISLIISKVMKAALAQRILLVIMWMQGLLRAKVLSLAFVAPLHGYVIF